MALPGQQKFFSEFKGPLPNTMLGNQATPFTEISVPVQDNTWQAFATPRPNRAAATVQNPTKDVAGNVNTHSIFYSTQNNKPKDGQGGIEVAPGGARVWDIVCPSGPIWVRGDTNAAGFAAAINVIGEDA